VVCGGDVVDASTVVVEAEDEVGATDGETSVAGPLVVVSGRDV